MQGQLGKRNPQLGPACQHPDLRRRQRQVTNLPGGEVVARRPADGGAITQRTYRRSERAQRAGVGKFWEYDLRVGRRLAHPHDEGDTLADPGGIGR